MSNVGDRPRRYGSARVLRLAGAHDALNPAQVQQAREQGPDSAAEQLCVCGHPRKAHEHYRPGTDCSLCVPGVCDRFRRQRTRRARTMVRPVTAIPAGKPFTATALGDRNPLRRR